MGVAPRTGLADRAVAGVRTPPPAPWERTRRLIRGVPAWGYAWLAYLALAVAAIGRGVIGGPAGTCACSGGSTDPSAYVWSLAWWPHALLAGVNPLFTHAIWAPEGTSVAAAATMPAAAIAMWPVTALFGPLTSYNVLAVLAPALAALTAYLLCRRLSGRHGPALVGGFLFGFSSFVLAQLGGHANLALVFLLPVFVHLALRRIAGELTRARFVAAFALAIVVQALLSTELLFDGLLLGAVALAIAALAGGRPLRARVTGVALEILAAGAAASIVLLPYLTAALAQAPAARSGDVYGLDALNLVVPSQVTWLGGQWLHALSSTFEGGDYLEAGGYVGVPLLIAFAAYAVSTWRRRIGTRVLVGVFLVGVVLALGSSLTIAGRSGLALPWSALTALPPFGDFVASRMIVFAALAVAIATARWLAQRGPGSARRRLIAGLGCLAVLPALSGGPWTSQPANPPFFAAGLYQRYLARGEGVLTIPFAAYGESMLWQAETGFAFTMPGGYVSDVLPAAAQHMLPVALLLTYGGLTPPQLGAVPVNEAAILRRFLVRAGVRQIVIEPGYQRPWTPILRRLAKPPRRVGGILLYTLD